MRDKYTEKKIADYRKQIDSKEMLETILRGKDQHMLSMHVGLDKVQIMDRVLSDQKSSSSFTDTDISEAYLVDTIYNKMPEIVEWCDSDRYRLELRASFADDDEPAQPEMGHGFRYDDIHRSVTYRYPNDTVVILQKDKDIQPYGFSLCTAYPEINKNAFRKNMTPEQMLDIIRQTDTYKNADTVKRGFYDYHAFYKNPEYGWRVNCKDDYMVGGSKVTVRFPFQDLVHVVSINKDDVWIAAYQGDKKVRPAPDLNKKGNALIDALCEQFPDNEAGLRAMKKTAMSPSTELKKEENTRKKDPVKQVMQTAQNIKARTQAQTAEYEP